MLNWCCMGQVPLRAVRWFGEYCIFVGASDCLIFLCSLEKVNDCRCEEKLSFWQCGLLVKSFTILSFDLIFKWCGIFAWSLGVFSSNRMFSDISLIFSDWDVNWLWTISWITTSDPARNIQPGKIGFTCHDACGSVVVGLGRHGSHRFFDRCCRVFSIACFGLFSTLTQILLSIPCAKFRSRTPLSGFKQLSNSNFCCKS